MSPQDYKMVKARSAISVADIWHSVVRISLDQDKAYSSGRTPIPPEVAFRVENLICRLEQGAIELEAILQQELPMCSIKLDTASLTIDISFPSGKAVQLHNRGVDWGNWPVFKADSSPKDAAVFLRIERPGWHKKDYPGKEGWYLWRGDFQENRNLGHMQNHWNIPKEKLLLETFKNYL